MGDPRQIGVEDAKQNMIGTAGRSLASICGYTDVVKRCQVTPAHGLHSAVETAPLRSSTARQRAGRAWALGVTSQFSGPLVEAGQTG
jgi:hypothetical protein